MENQILRRDSNLLVGFETVKPQCPFFCKAQGLRESFGPRNLMQDFSIKSHRPFYRTCLILFVRILVSVILFFVFLAARRWEELQRSKKWKNFLKRYRANPLSIMHPAIIFRIGWPPAVNSGSPPVSERLRHRILKMWKA